MLARLLSLTSFVLFVLVLPPGFEPGSSPHLEASPEYKAGALPLSYGSKLVRTEGIEPNRQPPSILRQEIYSLPLGTARMHIQTHDSLACLLGHVLEYEL